MHIHQEAEPAYVKYTPNPDAPGYNPAASQRVIELVEAQVDPLEPPKHKHKKVRGRNYEKGKRSGRIGPYVALWYATSLLLCSPPL